MTEYFSHNLYLSLLITFKGYGKRGDNVWSFLQIENK